MARVALGASLLLAASLATTTARAADPARARELFREGNQAFAAGDLHGAYEAYQEAWSLHRSFDVACNLGRTEAELGLHVAAAEHLDYCLRTFSTSGKDEFRGAELKFRELLDRERKQVGALRINSRPLEVEVLVDGVAMGTGPFHHDLFVAPGEHRLVLRAKGYRPRELRVGVEAGGTNSVQVRLELEGASVAPAPAAPTAPVASARAEAASPLLSVTEPSKARTADVRTVVTLAGAALTFAGLTVGTAYMLDAGDAADESDTMREEAATLGCDDGAVAPTCRDYRASLDREAESRDVADIAFVTSGVVGAMTVVAWLLLPDRAAERVQAVKPYFNQQGAGVSLTALY